MTTLATNRHLLYTVDALAQAVGLSTSTVRRCIRLTKKSEQGWPPLPAKRLPDGQLRITAEAAAEWIANLPDA